MEYPVENATNRITKAQLQQEKLVGTTCFFKKENKKWTISKIVKLKHKTG